MGYTEAEVLQKSPGEVRGILKAFDRLHELSSKKPGTTYKIKRKRK